MEELYQTGNFPKLTIGQDEDEHSVEMELPYLRKVCEGYVGVLFLLLHTHTDLDTKQKGYQDCTDPRW